MSSNFFAGQFSVPLGGAAPFGRLPHYYKDTEDLVVAFEAAADRMTCFLPPGVEPADDPVPCRAKARWAPFTFYGPYHEAYLEITVTFRGERYRYVPVIMTDSDVPLIAGREIWGYPKKLARISHSWGQTGATHAEHYAATVERPSGVRLMTISSTCDRLYEPGETESLPALSLKLIPDAEGGERPALAQLVSLQVEGKFHTGADGVPFHFAGRGALEFGGASASDPWHRFAPVRILAGYFGRLDFCLTAGRIVHDYLAD